MPSLIKIGVDQQVNELQIPGKTKTLDEITKRLPPGVYTTLRTYQKTKVLALEGHFMRLEESARLLGKRILLDRGLLRKTLRRFVLDLPFQEVRIRIILDCGLEKGTIYVVSENLSTPTEHDYSNGVYIAIHSGSRENPQAKTTSFITAAGEIRAKHFDPNLNEILLANDEGNILEGLTSNFFGVKETIIYTAGEGILHGLTRDLVVSIITLENLKLVYKPVNIHEVTNLGEAFITSTSRGILPVVRIGNIQVGDGKPGKITRRISELFREKLAGDLEEL